MEAQNHKKKHNGRGHDRAFKLAAVKLVTEQGYSPKEAAKSLGLHTSTLQYWIKTISEVSEEAETIDSLRMKVKELERQNQRLLVEKEILKKATAFFAQEPK